MYNITYLFCKWKSKNLTHKHIQYMFFIWKLITVLVFYKRLAFFSKNNLGSKIMRISIKKKRNYNKGKEN